MKFDVDKFIQTMIDKFSNHYCELEIKQKTQNAQLIEMRNCLPQPQLTVQSLRENQGFVIGKLKIQSGFFFGKGPVENLFTVLSKTTSMTDSKQLGELLNRHWVNKWTRLAKIPENLLVDAIIETVEIEHANGIYQKMTESELSLLMKVLERKTSSQQN